ncbi:MAG: hypothetical protein K2O04_05675 [Clostridiales bacterium]|nr:hypothetical protein [Clostridiales bacterium]
MFLSALQGYVVFIIIAVVMLQYAFAVFCLLKLAYLDIPKKRYILWNLFILIVFFIGGTAFLVYYSKHPDLRIPKDALPEQTEQPREEKTEEQTAASETTENADNE